MTKVRKGEILPSDVPVLPHLNNTCENQRHLLETLHNFFADPQ